MEAGLRNMGRALFGAGDTGISQCSQRMVDGACIERDIQTWIVVLVSSFQAIYSKAKRHTG